MSLPSSHDREAATRREQVVAAWVDALRRQADAATLKSLPTLADEDAARVMALLRGEAETPDAVVTDVAELEAAIAGLLEGRTP